MSLVDVSRGVYYFGWVGVWLSIINVDWVVGASRHSVDAAASVGERGFSWEGLFDYLLREWNYSFDLLGYRAGQLREVYGLDAVAR